MWQWLLSREQQRRRLYKQLPDGPLRNYYSVPFSHKSLPLHELELVAVDLETTGFDPQRDAILSIGRVDIIKSQIELATARHTIIRAHKEITADSAVVHGITDDASAAGVPLREALEELLTELRGKVMLVHYAGVERSFLDAACQKLFGGPFMIPVVDTFHLARRRYERQQQSYQANDLRLHKLRARLGLPRYPAHNALSDALATAELYLLQTAQAGSHEMRLSDILLPGRRQAFR